MKIILTQDVDTLGTSGDVVDVSNGYARNYLIPKRLAMRATTSVIRHFEEREKAIANRIAKEIQLAEEAGRDLESKSITVKAKVGEEGKLYGTVTNKEIALAIQEQLNTEVDRKKIDIPVPIRHVGTHEVKVKLHSRVTATLKVNVEAQEE